MQRGQIYYADLENVVGSEQGGIRPVLIIQNDVGNKYSPTVIVAAITSKMTKSFLPTHIYVKLDKPSLILTEQLKTIDKRRLRNYVCKLPKSKMQEVDKALAVSLEL